MNNTNTVFSEKFYMRCHRYAGPVIRFFRPFSVTGGENIPAGAAVVCGNHSAMIDPLLIALSFDINTQVHVFAKIELFKVPVISWLIRKLGAIPVNRSIADPASVKTAMQYLKAGKKVVVFPEGTRMSEHDAGIAKSGAVKMAERMGVPILPVYLPRKKPLFRKSSLVFGTPYLIEKPKEKRSTEEYAALSGQLMNSIEALGQK